MRLYWVRHGATAESEKAQYYGRLDTPLSASGIEEVKRILVDFGGCSTVYTSPAARATQTAELLFQGRDVQVDTRLAERDMGVFEGMDDDALARKYPLWRQAWYADWEHYILPEGESARMQYARVKAFVQSCEEQGEDAVVVCHAGTIRMALAYMFGEDINMFWRFKVDTGAVVTTVYTDGYWYLEMARK